MEGRHRGKRMGGMINMRDHKLNIPCFKNGFSPGDIKAMFFETKDAWRDKADLRHIQAELKTTQEALKAERLLPTAGGREYYI